MSVGSEPAIERVAVIGGGFMGSGIAETIAVAGMPVTVVEVDAAHAAAARRRIEASLARALSRGKLGEAERDAAIARVTLTTDLDAVADVDLAIEVVAEEVELKERVMRELDRRLSERALIASNTSSIPIAHLAANVRERGRVLGLHFFAPVPVMGLVEVVRALDTDAAALRAAHAFAARLGKHPIETKDRSGFIVNMLLVPYLMAAVRMYEEGFASAEDIDAGMRLGCGHPMGPLALCDLIGLDVLYAIGNSLFEEFKRDEYAPPPLLKRMLASGRLGKKSGRGFHAYAT